jgi:hypothetical protein
MVPSILIIATSCVLLGYWFRYSCLLLLRGQAEHLEHTPVADSFQFRDVQKRIHIESQLDPLHRRLDRDYQVLTYLLEHAYGLGVKRFEDRLLMCDYLAMQWCYRLTKTAAPKQARRALREMASVLDILAGRMDRRAGLQQQA